MSEETSRGNLFNIKFYDYSKHVFPPGRCCLCGGDHTKDNPINRIVRCVKCSKEQEFSIKPHCPGGVSHMESHNCISCGYENFVVVYWNGDYFLEKYRIERDVKI